ncbi:Hypp8626 [Branchiostoma lanceolatum]|uniref:Hypp8626 protein n=1 Tax=Branchiostoma lanceolatum TaxID=7740 RepID=A0A8J9ZA24_BRALA|nr:Hypp8626 [Branchiostoma lanceolatum]
MLVWLCVVVLVSQVTGQQCNSNLDCPGGCCRVDGTAVSGWVMPSNTDDSRGTCGPYLQEGESCSLGYPVASSADCMCDRGLSCYPEGGWFSGACRVAGSQTYPPVVGPLPVG